MTVTEFLEQLRALVPEERWDDTLIFIEESCDYGSSIEVPDITVTEADVGTGKPEIFILRLS